MARIRITPLQNKDLSKVVNDIGTSKTLEDLSLVTTYAFRAKILLDRNIRGFEKAEVKGPRDAFETSGLPIMETSRLEREKKIREARSGRYQDNSRTPNDYEYERSSNKDPRVTLETPNGRFLEDTITIADIDSTPYKTITLPFIPRELSYQPTSKFIGIATMGRNNPHYHFTGSEDSLQFEIDWFSSKSNREDVINSCREIEALTKSNAYDDLPHRVKLIWSKDDKLFQDDIWLITDAPYVLSDFVKGYRDSNEMIVRVGMLPQQAIQTITLKRLTVNNRTTKEILGKLNKQ